MNWIDITLMLANIVSMVGTLPTVFDKRSAVPRASSILKAIAGTATIPCYMALEIYWTTAAACVMNIAWWFIVIYRTPK